MKQFGEIVSTESEPEEEETPKTEDDIAMDKLIEEYQIKLPKNWESYRREARLEFIAHRMLIQSRTSTSHKVMSEEGWLSEPQLERRRRREVFSKFGSLDEVPPVRGVFSRTHRKNTK